MNKITVVGAGRVGESTAQFIASKDLCRELVLIDIREGAAEGAALDIQEDAPLFQFDTRLKGGTDHALMADSDLIIVTAGIPRKPGMSRDDLISTNAKIVTSVTTGILEHSENPIIIIVSNPLDVMTYAAHSVSGLSDKRRPMICYIFLIGI